MDKKDDADYLPTVFVYTKTVDTLKQAQKEERMRRLEQRRALVDKKNQPERENYPGGENPREDDANDDPIHEVGTQTFLSEQCDIGTQTTNSEHCTVMSPCAMTRQSHSVPMMCYIPVESQFFGHAQFGCDIIKENDSATKFYTSLGSWTLF